MNPKLFMWSYFCYYPFIWHVLEVKQVPCEISVMCEGLYCGYRIQNGILENVAYISNAVKNFIGM